MTDIVEVKAFVRRIGGAELLENRAGTVYALQRGVFGRASGSAVSEELLNRFDAIFKSRWFWAEDTSAHRKALGEAVLFSGDKAVWKLRASRDLVRQDEITAQGGWAALFCREDPGHPPKMPEVMPTKPDAIQALMASMAAGALILSWYDNTEWVIALTA